MVTSYSVGLLRHFLLELLAHVRAEELSLTRPAFFLLIWGLLAFSPAAAQTPIFINEIHYDNTGGDTGEAIEIAGPAGSDLTGWSLVLYNGANGANYGTISLSGFIADLGNGFGVVAVNSPVAIQNGAPDGVALVNAASVVVQFLSYEGTFTATAGPANGLTSIDIGVSETEATPIGASLQLSGTGVNYEDFTWSSAVANTFGAFNNDQTFAGGDAAPSVTNTSPANGASGVAITTTIMIEFSEAVEVNGSWFSISGSLSSAHTATVSGGPQSFILDPNDEFANDEIVTVTVFAANVTDQDTHDPPDNMTADFSFSFTTMAGDVAPSIINTSPANGASGVAIATNLTIDFSEAVTVAGSWFSILGSSSGAHTATISSGPQSFTLDPDVDFAHDETVTVTIFGANVADQDDNDPPDNMAADFSFSFVTASPPSMIINEILADPDATNGDANGDGAVNTTQDEFVELVNVSNAELDLSGWTLSDVVQVRHTFPAGTFVKGQCTIVVFGGGTPAGAFGDAIVQTASTNQLGLNNTGDTITLRDANNVIIASYTYGAEGNDNQSLTRAPDLTGGEPFIRHSLATGASGRLHSPGTQVDGTPFSGCVATTLTKEIFEIQASGLTSPFEGQIVTTENNVVTALRSDGFFMQTPSERSDNDAATSDGIFVYTNTAPAVAIGDLVRVTGQVIEFFEFTQFDNVSDIAVISSGNALPPAVSLDGLTPSPDQPQSATEFERFESMRVEIAEGIATSPNQSFGSDPLAEVFIVAGNARAFREPGIAFPGLSGLPVWDGNPEIFELDPDRLGQPNVEIPAGSSFSATGVLAYEFGDYELWPVQYSINPVALPRPVRARAAGEATIATLNAHLLYDDVDDPALAEPVLTAQEYAGKLSKLSQYIRNLLDAPEILAIQEAENLNTLQALADQINNDDGTINYTPYLVEGNDISGVDVGFLVRNSVTVNSLTQFGASETLSLDGSLLHDRPPLLLEAVLPNGQPVSVLNLHLRSLNDIEDATEGPRVRQKRHEQAVSVSNMAQGLQTGSPSINLIVTGDFNAFQFTDGYVDVLGQIMGTPSDASQALLPGSDHVNPDLINQVLMLPEDEQYSFIHAGSAQALDHMLVSQALEAFASDIAYARGNADAPEIFASDASTAMRASDHDGLVLYIRAPLSADAGENKVICAGGSVVIGGAPAAMGGAGGPYTFSWSPSEGLSDATIANPTASPQLTTTYALTVTEPATGLIATDEVTITVSSDLAVTFDPVGEFCATSPALDLSDFVSPEGGTFSGPGVSGNMFDPKEAGPGTHTIVYSISASGCGGNAAQEIIVRQPPLVNAGESRAVCFGETVTLGGSPTATGEGPFTYSWIPATGLDDAQAANPKARLTGDAEYIVEVTDANGCTAADTITLTVHNFVFLSDEEVKIDGNRESNGNIHSNTKISFGTGTGSPGTHTGNLSGGDKAAITIGNKNTIVGDVICGGKLYLSRTAKITGTKKDQAEVARIPPPALSFGAGGASHEVKANKTLALAPGAYNRLKVKRKGTLKLRSGDYYFNTLDTDPFAGILLDVTDGPVNVNIVEEFDIDENVQIKITPEGEAGTDRVTFNLKQVPKLDIGKGARVLGAFIASHAEIHFSKDSKFRGSICSGGSITVEARVPFQFHGSATPLPKEESDEMKFVDNAQPVTNYALSQNYPNPFNPETRIRFALPEAGEVNLRIYNEAGQLVRELVDGRISSGRHELTWDGRDRTGRLAATGVYFYRLVIRGETGEVILKETRRMTLLK